jgi:CRP/FNR family transcriptional regulator, dissimilatory nitrate respiration regulator
MGAFAEIAAGLRRANEVTCFGFSVGQHPALKDRVRAAPFASHGSRGSRISPRHVLLAAVAVAGLTDAMGAHNNSFGTLDFLRNLPLFRDLELCELEAIGAATTEQRVAVGTVLFRRGDPCEGFHVIVLGRVKLALFAADGAEKVVEILGPGQSFGEPVMFIGRPHVLCAEALSESLLLFVHKTAIREAIRRNPEFAHRMLNELSLRLYRLVADIEAYTLKSATERVTGYLLAALPDDAGPGRPADVALAASKSVLASRLNITREHFSRILHELSQAGLIQVSGRNIRVLDPGGLRDRKT